MKYTYIAAFKVRGLIHAPDRGDIEIYVDQKRKSKAILTDDVFGHCHELYRARAVAYLLLKGFAGQGGAQSLTDAINAEVKRIRETKDKDIGESEVLVFTAEGDTDADFGRGSREEEDFILGFDVIDKTALIERHGPQSSAALTALFLSTDHDIIQVTQLARDVYLTNEHQKPVFSISFSAHGEGYSSIKTDDKIIEKTQSCSKVLAKERPISAVNRLIVHAMSAENDRLRRFISAWSALEILLNKVFSEYERKFVANLLGTEPQKHTEKYFERIRDVMKDKYRLTEKFIVLSACLNGDEAELDMKAFASIKEKRDAFFHGKSKKEETLPLGETLRLLKKYLQLHIAAKGA